jgi:hypothetical protein
MQRGYIVLIVGAALLIPGIVVSTSWAVPFAGKILRGDTIMGGASVRPTGSVNASIQIIDTLRPLSLAIHVERNNGCWGTNTKQQPKRDCTKSKWYYNDK